MRSPALVVSTTRCTDSAGACVSTPSALFTCGSRIRATSQQLPVNSNATRSDGSRFSATVLNPLRRARHPTGRPDPAVLTDRHHSEIATGIRADRATNRSRQIPTLTSTRLRCARTSATTTQTDPSSQLNPGKSQGRPNKTPGLEAHRPKTAYPSASMGSTTTGRAITPAAFAICESGGVGCGFVA